MNQLPHDDLVRFQKMLKERTGLHFGKTKQRDLAVRLRAAMRSDDYPNLGAFYTRLWAAPLDEKVWTDLIARLTVGETYFMRNPAHFAALRASILPELIELRRAEGRKVLRLWSAGCATGEEPYSLAITLCELLPDIEQWSIMILATDINRESLAQAVKGVYRARSFRNDTPATFRNRYFKSGDREWILDAAIRRMVHFSYLNLAEASYPSVTSYTSGLDLIVCRNVTIYFDQQTTREVASRFNAALTDGGWLLVGHSEPQNSTYIGFESCNFEGAIAYQKAAELEVADGGRPSVIFTPAARDSTFSLWDKPAPLTTPDPAGQKFSTNGKQSAQTTELVSGQAEVSDREAAQQLSTAEGCFEVGKSYADRMQWDEAGTWLEQAVALDPLMLEGRFMQALVHQHQGDDEAARAAIKRALYLDGSFVLGHFNLGVICQRMGRSADAQRAWRTTHELLMALQPGELILHGDGLTAGELAVTLSVCATGMV